MKSIAKLCLVAALFVLALATNRPSYAACSVACEQNCVGIFDRCVAAAGGWNANCQRIYDGCAFRCGC